MKELLGRVIRLSIPTYDETSLFGLSLSFLLVFTFSDSFRFREWRSFEGSVYLIYALFFTGMALSVMNALIPRWKTAIERKLMLWFAVVGNGMSAIWAGGLTLERGFDLFSLFPILNIINGFILLVLPRTVGLNEENVPDEDAGIRDIIRITVAVTAVFFIGERVVKNIWPFTLAMCVVYANNLNRPFTSGFQRIRGGGGRTGQK